MKEENPKKEKKPRMARMHTNEEKTFSASLFVLVRAIRGHRIFLFCFRISGLGFHSDFGFRASDFDYNV
jgi:hypothetical protein